MLFDDFFSKNFSLIQPFCDEVKAYLDKNNRNQAIVYCKAGKGQTHIMICCYLLFFKILGIFLSCLLYFDDFFFNNFSLIQPFCDEVKAYLDKDDRNRAVVHCKAGKGLTGIMICCYLLFSRILQFFLLYFDDFFSKISA